MSPTPESVCPFRCVDHPQPGPGFPQGHSPPGTRVDLETPSEHADTPRLPRGRGKNPNFRPRLEPGHLAASGPSTCLLCWAVSRRSLLSGKRPSQLLLPHFLQVLREVKWLMSYPPCTGNGRGRGGGRLSTVACAVTPDSEHSRHRGGKGWSVLAATQPRLTLGVTCASVSLTSE